MRKSFTKTVVKLRKEAVETPELDGGVEGEKKEFNGTDAVLPTDVKKKLDTDKSLSAQLSVVEDEDKEDDEDLKEGEEKDDEDLKEEDEDEDLKEGEDKDDEDLKEEDEDEDKKDVKEGFDKEDLEESEDEEDPLAEEEDEDLKEDEDEKKEIEEHCNALFKGKSLSEEFRAKSQVVFEAAVKATAAKRVQKVKAKLGKKISVFKENHQKNLAKKVEKYLDYVIENWIDENRLAIETGHKVEIVEGFLSGMKGLFEAHYVDVPKSKVNLLDTQAATIEKLEEKASKFLASNASLTRELNEMKKDKAIEKACAELSENQKSKLKDLVEKVEFTDEKTFEKKVSVIKESYFSKDKPKAMKSLHEGVVDAGGIEQGKVATDMDRYVEAARRTAQK